jgi:hypothetical protein
MTGNYTRTGARWRALSISAVLLLAVWWGTAQPALAWTVSPADIHLSAKPGIITRGSFEVISADSVGRDFRVVAQNLGETDSGAFTFTNAGHSAAQWIDILPSSLTGSHSAQSVDYAISVPSNASPGDHVAAISVQELPAKSSGNIGVVEAVGIRVVIRVPGKLHPAAQITDFGAPALTFGDGVGIHATVVNTGDTVLDFNGANAGSGISVAKQKYPLSGILVPGARRTISYGWNTPPLIGATAAHLRVNLAPAQVLSASTSIFAFPLYQVLGLILFMLAVYLYRRRRQQARNSSRSSDLALRGA